MAQLAWHRFLHRSHRLLGAMTLFILCLWWGSVFVAIASKKLHDPYHHPHDHQDHARNAEATSTGGLTENKQDSADGYGEISWKEYTAGTLALLSFIISWYALRAASRNADAAIAGAQATQTSVELASETAQRQLRAYIEIKISEVFPIVPGQMFRFLFVPVNHGPTPAREFAFRGYNEVFRVTDKLPPITDANTWNLDRMIVFPHNASVPFYVHNDTGKFPTNEELAAVERGTHRLVAAMEIRYRDAFDKVQHATASFWFEYHRNFVDKPIPVHLIPGTSRIWTE